MYLDFAPMEGITGALFRRLHHRYFPGVDRYFTPFVSPTSDRRFTPRELREILPEHNAGIRVIPQLLTKNPEDFLWAARELHAMGYEEINLNLGCPSGTVTAKGKGAGMLADLQALERFLDAVFRDSPCCISVKTRLGMENPEEFGPIMEIYQRYPISELIVHPRVRKDFYRHPVRQTAFEAAYRVSRLPISYNGGIVTPEDYHACAARWPSVKAIMIGQGLVSDLFLPQKIRGMAGGQKETIRQFHDALLECYAEQFGSRNNAAKRMKEIWIYLIRSFDNSEKYGKRILKARTLEEYQDAVAAVFSDLTLLERSTGGW